MCYHRYTSHPCGHKSQSLGKCTIDTLATQVPFCAQYHVLTDRSLTSCGGSYCKEDKETAHWVENGSTLLNACNDDLANLKYRLQTLHRELLAAAGYKEAFGSLQGKEIDKARSKHEEYLKLRQIYSETRDRRQLIWDGIRKAKEKQQAEHADKMHRIQQYVNARKVHSASAASLHSIPKANHALEGRTSMKRTYSSIWEAQDTSATPCRPTTSLSSPFERTPKLLNAPSLVYSTPPSLATPISLTDQKAELVSNASPRKKRRGRPPKAIHGAEVGIQSQITFEVPVQVTQIDKHESPVANDQPTVPKRQPSRHSTKKESPVRRVSPAGVRRSKRHKQRVSYAESPSPSPEHSASDQPEHDVELTAVSRSLKPPRATRATSSKKKLQQDDVYATDEDDDDDDDEWQGDGRAGEDNMDIEPTPVQKARSSTKRTAASPPSNSRPIKRQVKIIPRNTAHRGSNQYDESGSVGINYQHDVPDSDHGVNYTIAQPTTSRGAYDMPSTPQNYSAPLNHRSTLTGHSNATADTVMFDAVDFQSRNPNDPDISPLRRSDWLNGLGGAGMVLSLDDIDDPNNYDFDVSAMSRIVADLDTQ